MVEVAQDDLKSVALLTEEVLNGNLNVVECNESGTSSRGV